MANKQTNKQTIVEEKENNKELADTKAMLKAFKFSFPWQHILMFIAKMEETCKERKSAVKTNAAGIKE